MIAKIIVSTHTTWTSVSRVHCIWTMEEFSLAVCFLDNIYDYAEHVDRFGGTWVLTV